MFASQFPSAPIARKRVHRIASLLAATALAGLTAVGTSQAADATEAGPAASADAASVGDVVVTARHRSENPEKIPVAITVIGGALLASTNTSNISQLSQLVPSVQFSFFNARNANINVRGLGNNIGLASDGIEPGVGFYVDQVYYDRPATATFDLVDIDQIEVLRGPQGTLFGKNTTAGAIVLTTAGPSFTPEATAEVSGGDYGYGQAKLSVAGPIIADVLAGRLSVAATTREGLITNVYGGDNKVNAYQNLTVRGQALYTPTSNVKLRVIADYSKQDTNCCDEVLDKIVTPPNGKNFLTYAAHFGYTPTVNPFARQTDTNAPIYARQETGGVSAEADWSLPKAVFTSITSGRFWNWWPANDGDYSPVSVLNYAQNGDYQNQISQEFRIASAGVNRVDYVGGLYFFREQIRAKALQQYGSAASYYLLGTTVPAIVANNLTLTSTPTFDTTSLAAFGQATWHLTDQWNLTGGLRYTYDHKFGQFNQIASGAASLAGAGYTGATLAKLTAARNALGASDDFNATVNKSDVSGQIDLSYQATSNVLAYLNYARGYKSAGLNMVQLPAGASAVVAPESIDSVEGGVKTRLFDHRVTVNADLFWEDDRNYQANVYDPTYGKQFLSNVPEVRSQGAEIDIQAQPIQSLSLYASGVYDDATYTSYANAPCGLEHANLSYCDLSGRPLAGTPRWTVSAGGEYDQPLTLGARQAEAYIGVDDTYRSSVFSSATDSIYSLLPSLDLVNARIGLRASNHSWDAYVWAKNLFDAKYLTFVSAGVGNTGALYAQLGDPQTYGVTLRVHY